MHRTRSRLGCLKAVFAATILLLATVCPAADRLSYVPPPHLTTELPQATVATGTRLGRTLTETVPGATWKQATLRDALATLAEGHSISVVRDRRIDLTQPIDLSSANVGLEALFAQVAHEANAEIRVVGNCVYVATADGAAVVRTLAELRIEELKAARPRKVSQRQIALQRSQSVRWPDLTDAGTVLGRVASRFDLTVENPDLVPHDLWGRGVFAEMSSAEMLTLVLIQFDLTYEWSDDLRSIRLVPLPTDRSKIVIKRSHRPRKLESDTIEIWKEEVGDITAEIVGDDVLVTARVEQHERIDRLIKGGAEKKGGNDGAAQPVPLTRRRFSLTVTGVSAKAVMKQLEQSGITFEFDSTLLKNAGIDLEMPVAIDVDQAGPREFFDALFGPLGLTSRFSGTTVRFEPVDRPR